MHHGQILVVLTNTREFPRREGQEEDLKAMPFDTPTKTGFDVKEVAYLYEYLYKQHKIELVLATPKGGESFIDPASMETSRNDDLVAKFMKDSEAMSKIKNTKKLRDVQNTKFLGAIFPGGPGVLFDLTNEPTINEMVQEVWARKEGFIASIGHGLAGLLNVKTNKGEPWLCGRRVTCQTLEEERDLKLERALPFMVEDKLKQIGAKFEKVNKFQPHVIEDDRLITAQNSYSTKEWVEVIGRRCQMLN